MEELQTRHRKEARDLQALVTQKKKAASKKTRKSVNDECARLEEDLKTRHAQEVKNVQSSDGGQDGQNAEQSADDTAAGLDDDLLDSIAGLSHGPSDEPKDAAGTTAADANTAPDASSARRPNRQKARMARRAAEQDALVAQAAAEADSLPDQRRIERERMAELIAARGLAEKEVAANGHCLYLSVADQLEQLRLDTDPASQAADPPRASPTAYKTVRAAAADYIARNRDDYAPFVEGSLDEHVERVRSTGEWGGHLELAALSKSYRIDINVVQADGDVVKIESGDADARGLAWLAYYRHGFGLGEHYNSLRAAKKA